MSVALLQEIVSLVCPYSCGGFSIISPFYTIYPNKSRKNSQLKYPYRLVKQLVKLVKQLHNQLNKLLKLTCQAYQRNQFTPTSVLIRSSQFPQLGGTAMLNKVSIGEAAVHYGVSQTTIHTWIKENKIQSERVSGRRWVFLEDKTSQETSQPDDETYQDELNFKIENEYLKQKVIDKEKQVEEANNQINELLKQQNQAQQLSAMQQKTIDRLTEQNQLLLETTQQKKPSFWQRLIGQKI